MEYKQIFTDIKTEDDIFLRLTVCAPVPGPDLPYKAPYLIKIETGDKGDEEWEVKWVLRSGFTSAANVIRQTIKLLDSTPLPPPIEDME